MAHAGGQTRLFQCAEKEAEPEFKCQDADWPVCMPAPRALEHGAPHSSDTRTVQEVPEKPVSRFVAGRRGFQ